MKKVYLRLIPVIVLLIVGPPLISLHIQHAFPSNLSDHALFYAGRCVKIDVETEWLGKHSRDTYLLTMEDGRKFWIDGLYATEGDFDFSGFYSSALVHSISLRYIDVNLSTGSFAKEVVEARIDDHVLLSMDVVEQANKKTRMGLWGLYAFFLLVFSWFLLSAIQDERAQRKLTAHRQQTKAKRREWLDAHPEEKGAPPSARRKRGRK